MTQNAALGNVITELADPAHSCNGCGSPRCPTCSKARSQYRRKQRKWRILKPKSRKRCTSCGQRSGFQLTENRLCERCACHDSAEHNSRRPRPVRGTGKPAPPATPTPDIPDEV